MRDTKLIANGVRARVVHDQVTEKGKVKEDTYDWYAQDRDGNVWYLGEDTTEFPKGKRPSKAGSWEAGVKGAKAGIAMPAHPRPGQSYRQEYFKGEAEDMAEVISLNGAGLNDAVITPYGSFGEDVLVTKDWSPLEPDILEHKYYAPGVGVIGEVTATGPAEKIALVDLKRG
jgi:hypothetical protein